MHFHFSVQLLFAISSCILSRCCADHGLRNSSSEIVPWETNVVNRRGKVPEWPLVNPFASQKGQEDQFFWRHELVWCVFKSLQWWCFHSPQAQQKELWELSYLENWGWARQSFPSIHEELGKAEKQAGEAQREFLMTPVGRQQLAATSASACADELQVLPSHKSMKFPFTLIFMGSHSNISKVSSSLLHYSWER